MIGVLSKVSILVRHSFELLMLGRNGTSRRAASEARETDITCMLFIIGCS